MPKRDFNKVAKQSNFIEITLRHACSPVNLLHIFKTPFTKNTSGWLLLVFTLKASEQIDSLLVSCCKTKNPVN